MTQPLNQILYGPPGTGKTYSTITKALDIIGVEYKNYEEAQELFQNELGKRIEFVTMHQSFSYEDFVQGLKPEASEDGSGVVFKYRNGVFKEICSRIYEDIIFSEGYAAMGWKYNEKIKVIVSFEDLFEIGTVAQIIKMLKMPDGSTTVIIQGKKKFIRGFVCVGETLRNPQ